MIEENQLSPNSNSDLIVLPSTQKSLSEGGSVLFTELSDNSFSILFYTNRGLIDNYAGFLFKSDNKNIQKTDYWGSTYKVKTLKPHWFWINFN